MYWCGWEVSRDENENIHEKKNNQNESDEILFYELAVITVELNEPISGLELINFLRSTEQFFVYVCVVMNKSLDSFQNYGRGKSNIDAKKSK